MLEQDALVDATQSVLQFSVRNRFQIGAGAVTAMLVISTLFVLAATLAILLDSVATIRRIPFLRLRADGAIVEPPAVGWHALVSHVWSTGQDQARVLKERLQVMVPRLKIFLE